MSEEKNTIVTITPDKDVLIKHRNNFQKTLLDNILDLRRHEFIKTIKPDYQRKNQQGKYEDIDELISAYKKGAANAKSYVDIIDGLLAMEAEGKLVEAWAEISETPTPVNADEAKDEAPAETPNAEKPEEVKEEDDAPAETGEDDAPVETEEAK